MTIPTEINEAPSTAAPTSRGQHPFTYDSPLPPEAVISTDEMSRRGSRHADYEAENRALTSLMQELIRPDGNVLQKLVETALSLCRAHTAGISILEEEDGLKIFRWHAVAGQWARFVGSTMPREISPSGNVLDQNRSLLISKPERYYPFPPQIAPPVVEMLLVPFRVNGEPVGTLWVIAHDESRQFDGEDQRLMASLGTFASATYQVRHSLHALEQSSKVLRESEELFRTLLEKLPAAAYTCNTEGLITFFNQRAVELWGRTPKLNDTEDRFCGSFKLYKCDGTPIHHDQCWMALAIEENEEYNGEEIVIEKPDGSQLTALAHANPIHDAAGNLVGAVNVLIDITERKRAEALAAQMAAIVESSDDAIISKDLNGIIRSWNKGAEKLFGYMVEEVIGKPVTILIPQDRIEEEPQILESIKRSEKVDHYETVRRRKDGTEIDISLTVSPVRDKNGNVIGASKIARDITERKRIETEREELLLKESAARADAEAANRSKDEFLAIVSHELRSPLSSILGWNRMLRDQRSMNPNIAQITDAIERSGRAQLQLIEDLLDTARIISGKMRLEVRPIELVNVIASALEIVRPAAESKGVIIIPMLDPNAGHITGDPDRLQQVIWNLLSNAVKFTPAGGQVQVELRRGPSDVRIVVQDTGEGISADLLPYVFDRFKQGESSTSRRLGLGLGLALVKHLVELHGGRVWVESPGKGMGSTFTVSLPVRAVLVKAGEGATSKDSTNERRLDGLRVLVVDDEEAARELVAFTLTLCGAEVTLVESSAAALNALELRDDRGLFDIIVSDIGMPGEDGYNLMRKVRSLADESIKSIPAVALTAYDRYEDRMRALQSGFQMHIAKPVDTDELITVVASLTGRLGTPGTDTK